jgi:hypothetical protein
MGWISACASMGEIAYCPVEQTESCLGHRRQLWIPRRSWLSSSCFFFWAAAAITAGGAGSRLYQPGSQPPYSFQRISVFTGALRRRPGPPTRRPTGIRLLGKLWGKAN